MIHTIILAAGYGNRSKEITRDTLKCIFPIYKSISTLEYNILSLIEHDFKTISVVGGYKIEKLHFFLNNFNQKHNFSVNIIDSGQIWRKGPLFSFLSSRSSILRDQKVSSLLLCAADTIIDGSIIKSISHLLKNDPNYFKIKEYFPIMFYLKNPLKNVLLQSFSTIIINKIDNVVEGINFIKTCDTNLKNNKPQDYNSNLKNLNIIIPIISLPVNFFDFASQAQNKDHTTVISVLNSYIKAGNIVHAVEINTDYSRILDSDDEYIPFHDFDTSQDREIIKVILKNNIQILQKLY